MERIRVRRWKTRRAALLPEALSLDPRDRDIQRAKALIRSRRTPEKGART